MKDSDVIFIIISVMAICLSYVIATASVNPLLSIMSMSLFIATVVVSALVLSFLEIDIIAISLIMGSLFLGAISAFLVMIAIPIVLASLGLGVIFKMIFKKVKRRKIRSVNLKEYLKNL